MKSRIWQLVALLTSLAGLQAQESPKPGNDPAFLKNAALEIDRHIAAFYRSKKLAVPAVTNDATYLRRAFLVAIGRLPTFEEARDFLELDEPAKREALITYLLKSPGYSSHMSNWAFDLLRVTDGRAGTSASNGPYRAWIRNAMAGNMPWDVFTSRLIAAAGDGWDADSAAVGYYTRDRGMPLDNLSNTMRVFLGSRMECAQCHDDPYGTTERRDFYELAAFTHDQSPLKQQLMQPLWNELNAEPKNQGEEYQVARVLWDQIYGMSLGGRGSGQIPLPADYQYRDGKPGDVVEAHTPFGKTVRMSARRDGNDGRQKLAEWMTTKTGDQFASLIANRMWKRVMGKGIYEPVDVHIPTEKTNSPELVSHLCKLMEELHYDLRAFQHVLLLTRTFQFATNPNPSSIEGGDDFHGRKIERLSSEQIWDSLITLANGNPDQQPPRALDDRIHVGNRPVLVGKKSMSQLSREVLALETESEVRGYFAKLVKEISNSTPSAGNGSMMMGGAANYQGDARVRASELPSPAPRNHFLYQFGASDREVIDASSREANVGQVLSLMNGYVQRELVNNPAARLYTNLKDAATPQEKIRLLYLAILTRLPTDDEMKWMLEEVTQRGEEGYRNIVSALVMSSEFLFLQ